MMAFEFRGAGALDYYPCRYGTSRLMFRGPRRRLKGDYVAALGGSATYGRFVARPYPALLERALGMTVINFGCMNAGVDVFAHDDAVLDACRGARAVVVQITGAQNLSNRFYAVHPRRNDRFVRGTAALAALYPEVDFTEFNFNRHMLQTLRARAPDRFEAVVAELKSVWVERMAALIGAIARPVLLLWLADHAPGDAARACLADAEPLFVDADMLARLQPLVAGVQVVVPSAAAQARGTTDMIFLETEASAAAALPGPLAHSEAAQALAPRLRQILLPPDPAGPCRL
ncbi:hypothetical protein ABIE69_000386 [Rhodobacteraceae bacterium MBR-64]